MKKVLLAFNVNHAIDLITNSSSELFVLEAKTEELVEEMIKNVYPDYLTEYQKPVSTKDLSTSDLDTYVDREYNTCTRQYVGGKNIYTYHPVLDIEPAKLWKDWDKKDKLEAENKFWYPQLTDEGAKLIKEKIDPENKMYFMFSLDENPNFEYQEKLSNIATRYHLG